MTSDEA
jgi:hypothetical protein